MTRREFTGAAAAFTIVPRHVLGAGQVAPSDKINLACIGMGRQGMAVMMELLTRPDVQVVAVCDVNRGSKDYAEYGRNAMLTAARRLLGRGYENWAEDLASPGEVWLTHEFKTSLGMGGREPAQRLVNAYYGRSRRSGNYKGCQAYADFRELLEKEKGVDAVYVATPDHWHAPIAIAAMRKRKHVLGQKPMAHSVGEARRMAAVAREMKVATSVTVNNPTSEATKRIIEWLRGGAIGKVREVHNWSSRPFWPQGVERPKDSMPVPEGLDWDLWLGPAPFRPFHKTYLPFVWRGWYDFGCGSFGDMGCYSFAGLFRILDLTPPTVVESSTSEAFPETYPKASMVHMTFPAKGDRPALKLTWYDGGLRPPRPEGLSADDQRFFAHRGEGILYVGDKGMLLAGFNGDSPRLVPASDRFVAPPRRRQEAGPDGAITQWLEACKGGKEPAASFPALAASTEAFLLGCIAQRMPGQRLEWDTNAMKVTSVASANQYVDPEYRGNWPRG